MNQITWLSVFYTKGYFILMLCFFIYIPSLVSLNESDVTNEQIIDYPSMKQILSKVKKAKQFDVLNDKEKNKTEPDELIIAPVRFNRLRRYFRHQRRMMRAQYRMMRLQRRLYRRHYRRPFGYFP
ncbi:unnamed protein product [Schistosoma rodhaini]|uniref:Uncharacterized protein n=1 Tax=Schistosoma rodhaini TaxID=6188 RepID=A0AA85FMV6_9TREM|nr:unnamed protein product [Schistosoma rodhaini]